MRGWIALFLALGVSACAPFAGMVFCWPSEEARWVLEDLAAREGPSSLKNRSSEPSLEAIRFRQGDREYQADLYRPSEPMAGIVLVPGAVAQGQRDARLVSFARTLARARFSVLVPGITGIQVEPNDAIDTAAAFSYMHSRTDLAPAGRVGLGAFSYSVGPVMIAAIDPQLRERVRFVLAIGGYHDLVEVLRFVTTGYYRVGGDWHHREPNQYGKWVFVLSNADRLPEPDRTLLQQMAQRKMADPAAPIEDLASRLGPEGRAVYDLVSNEDPHRVPALVDALPEPIREDILALDLANKDLSSLQARAILVHGKDDPIIPYTQSVSLARTITNAQLFLPSGLMHVDVQEFDLFAGWQLACAVDALLAQRF